MPPASFVMLAAASSLIAGMLPQNFAARRLCNPEPPDLSPNAARSNEEQNSPFMTATYVNVVRAVAAIITLAIYPLVLVLPSQAAWENQIVENTQVAVLVAGCVAAVAFCVRSRGQWRWFWLVTAMIWLLLSGREISWGGSFYPLTRMTVLGPFFSARELWYWPVIYPLVGVLGLAMLFIVIRYRTWETCKDIVQDRSAPIAETLCVVALSVISLAGEGRAGPLSTFLPHSIVFEELAELAAYVWLLAAQFVTEDYRTQKFRIICSTC
jgi:hypothetical protein